MLARIACLSLVALSAVPALADHPYGSLDLPRVELFDWVERIEPLSYRARYNRPRYVGGKVAFYIAPSSQGAMSWHENVHNGNYRNHAGPTVKKYYYPKPWEALQVGPRSATQGQYKVIDVSPAEVESVIIEPPAN
ncbi:hypothetical protein EC9_04530 [Rosistilla ulvae]|uniref:Uncharacterized protein n=1 Tax=Rosistilla ulvae TaxID=1930277 RepID=A0A517LUJ3_9BACT|nr:hypothetical protein [Rosistilla ulvae]QDS86292.1 hypothetical protein EC9_04530 [Rosistilla ulvae]